MKLWPGGSFYFSQFWQVSQIKKTNNPQRLKQISSDLFMEHLRINYQRNETANPTFLTAFQTLPLSFAHSLTSYIFSFSSSAVSSSSPCSSKLLTGALTSKSCCDKSNSETSAVASGSSRVMELFRSVFTVEVLSGGLYRFLSNV